MPSPKSSFEPVRRIGLTLAGVEESSMYGAPAIKLQGRLLACLASHKSAEPGTLVVRTTFEQREGLIAEQPETYYLTDHYVNHPVVLVRLPAIKADQLQDLIAAAWRIVAAEKSRRPARASKGKTVPPGGFINDRKSNSRKRTPEI